MNFIKLFLILFISINFPVKAELNNNLIKELKKGGKFIFIRHAYAPGGGDPDNFDVNDCDTQRNLNDLGKFQAKKIGHIFKRNKIPIEKVFSSEWCRCKETALLSFKKFETKNFLNSFFSTKFAHKKEGQIKDLKNFIKNNNSKKKYNFYYPLCGYQ